MRRMGGKIKSGLGKELPGNTAGLEPCRRLYITDDKNCALPSQSDRALSDLIQAVTQKQPFRTLGFGDPSSPRKNVLKTVKHSLKHIY